MVYQLPFFSQLTYDTRKPGITLPIILAAGIHEIFLEAKLDTGATDCIFERAHGEALGLTIEQGIFKRFSTATGTFEAYGHTVNLTVAEWSHETLVFFAKEDTFNRNVLGCNGFVGRVLLGLNDYAGKIYLGNPVDPE